MLAVIAQLQLLEECLNSFFHNDLRFFVLKSGMHQPLNQTEVHHDTSGGTNTVPPLKFFEGLTQAEPDRA
jgi:hypothetical protein